MALAGAAQAATEPSADLVKRGEYLSHLGDCIACHTAADGKPMAGGLVLETPFGPLYSTNITPDPATGIGNYTFEQFDRAMRKGVAADGHNLYPAMPFPSYAKTTDEDMKALYAYMQHGVTPVVQANRPSGMKWPFNIRWGLKFWNALFLDNAIFKPDLSQSDAWNRGAYIAQSLGHCGSCHTPRGLAFQEKAMDQSGSSGQKYLSGFTVENWHAVNLRDLWTVPETVRFLKTGRNSFGAAAGSMTEVISHSTQHFTDADLNALAQYLKSLPTPAGADKPKAPAVYAQTSEADLYKTPGGLGYVQFCGTCHRRDGRGVGEIFPTLAQNSSVQSKDPVSLIHIVLTGGNTATTQHSPRVFGMPEYSSLDDKEIAEILTFARTQWGNQGEPVTADDVRKVRDDLKLKPAQPTKFVTPRFAAMLDKPNADQLIRGMRLMVDTKALLPNNVGDGLNCGSCHLNGGTVAGGSPYVGLSAFFPSEAPRAGKVIDLADRFNGCFKRSMNGKPLPKDSPDMKAMIAYSDWMRGNFKKGDKVPGRGTGKVDEKLVANLENGKHVYGEQCAVCHGSDGEGLKHADGSFIFPPLWGDQSFNIGAGMARTYKAASFVKANMVIGHGNKFPLAQGNLSDQDAVDVSEYFTHMPRPDFPDKVKDWPKGGKPADARY
ncbi:c-type cytochrome [Rhodoferax sp.]|uniref:c-type cytochrome n=1 Tax=Rhodoferax sp. TaxID=50421 RepID=UPI00284B3791|nr:c-type cytochrome [Rhodoferax sp.]MDR3367610.1 c-type cytochrome [Rhodoferax sp.]